MKSKVRIFSESSKLTAESFSRGMTLIDTIVGVALMTIVFVGVAAAFQLSLDVVTNNRARAGAIAVADQRMEYVRSLPYASVGTVGGIPAGVVPQNETLIFNGITYTRHTFIEYEDDPKDGTGAADSNGIVEDYKSVKVDVSWTSRSGVRHITLVTRVSPAAGLESNVPGGTLSIIVTNSVGTPLSGASISIVNASTSPGVNISTFSDASGTATFLGAPASAGYQIVVTKPGYSTAQTYSATGTNTNPNPGNLTVTNNRTTSATFAIDLLGSKAINTWTPVRAGSWSDSFADASKVATATAAYVSGGTAQLSPAATSGELQSVAIGQSYMNTWGTLIITDTKPSGTDIAYHVYDGSGSTLVPDTMLPGNASGFSSGSVSLAGISTSTYPNVRLDAVFSGTASTSPALDSWSVSYTYGPVPLPNIALAIQGAKTIGSGPGGVVYKYSSTTSSGSASSVTIPNLEYDNYTLSDLSASYDISSACNPQPESLSPGASMTSNLFFAPHTANSLLIDIHAAGTGALIPGAYASISRTGFTATSTADACGQTFFSGLTNTTYTVAVGAAGRATTTVNNVPVSGNGTLSVTIN